MFQYEIGRNWIKKGKGSLYYSAWPRRSCHRAACRPPLPSGTAYARVDTPPSSWRTRAGAGTARECDPSAIFFLLPLLSSSPTNFTTSPNLPLLLLRCPISLNHSSTTSLHIVGVWSCHLSWPNLRAHSIAVAAACHCR